MMYEETCQLGFKQTADFPIYNQAYDSDNSNDYDYPDENDMSYNHNQQNNKSINEDLKHLVSNAQLKINFDKKVKFAEQLSFMLDHVPMFKSEEPQHIEFSNNLKTGLVNNKRSVSKTNKKKNKKNNKFNMPWMKTNRPKSAKKKINQNAEVADGSWNVDTRTAKYFDVKIDKKAQKEFEKQQNERNIRPNSAAIKSDIVVNKNFEEGKVQVGFLKSNGQVGSKFEVYQNIDTLQETHHKQNYAATGYSMKKMLQNKSPVKKVLVPAYKGSSSPQKHGEIQIAQSLNGNDHHGRQLAHMRQLEHVSGQPSLQLPNQSSIVLSTDLDLKMQHLIGQTLQSKEAMIEALQNELHKERNHYQQVTIQFKEQIKDMETETKALDRIKKATHSMERKQQHQSSLQSRYNRFITIDNHYRQLRLLQDKQMEDELDMVPTKEKSTTRKTINSSRSSKKGLKQVNQASFRPDRVKSSIPKIGGSQRPAVKQTQNPQNFFEELKLQEIERAIHQQSQQQIQDQVIAKLRDHPNEELNVLQTEVQMLNRKVEPLLRRVEQAAKNINTASSHPQRQLPGPLGMLSRMGGRLINYYADDLTDLLLDDFLAETAIELQTLEQSAKKDYSQDQARQFAESLLKNVIDYQSEEQYLDMKWNNPAHKINKGQARVFGHRADPQPITFNLDEEDEDQSFQDKSIGDNKQLKQQQKSYANPFNKEGGKVNAFSQKLAEISASAPDISYNMMTKSIEQNTHLQIKGAQNENIPIKRKYKIEMDPDTVDSIVRHRDKYDRQMKLQNNTASEEIWKVYDKLAEDIFNETYSEAMKKVSKDMEEYIESVILNEFQLSQ